METIVSILATFTSPPDQSLIRDVPDSGATALLLSVGIIGLGALARFIKSKK